MYIVKKEVYVIGFLLLLGAIAGLFVESVHFEGLQHFTGFDVANNSDVFGNETVNVSFSNQTLNQTDSFNETENSSSNETVPEEIIAGIQANCGGGTPCSCGDTLTSSRIMDGSDSLTGCTGTAALEINISNVILDCNGYTINTPGSSPLGIRLGSGVNRNIEIKNCIVENFSSSQIALYVYNSDPLGLATNYTITNVTLRSPASGNGLNLYNIHQFFVRDSTFLSYRPLAGSQPTGLWLSNVTQGIVHPNVFNETVGIEGGRSIRHMIVSENEYINNTVYLFRTSGAFENNTFKNENTTSELSFMSIYLTLSNDTLDNKFINLSLVLGNYSSGGQTIFLQPNSTFMYAGNDQATTFLRVQNASEFRGQLVFTRFVFGWEDNNVSIMDRTSNRGVNYTLLTDYPGENVSVYVNSVLNSSFITDSEGEGSVVLEYGTQETKNLTFLFDIGNYPNCYDTSGNVTITTNTIWNQSYTCYNVTVTNNAVLTFDSRTAGNKSINLTTTYLTVDSGSGITSTGMGHLKSFGPGTGSGTYSGAAYGGYEGQGVGVIYGSVTEPLDVGSGGYHDTLGSDGGGAIYLNVSDTFYLNGLISSNGSKSIFGAGSGGSVYIRANTLTGSGVVTASGGDQGTFAAAAGGGGRIAVYYTTNSYTGQFEAFGGRANYASDHGGSGTVYLKSSLQNYGDLYVVGDSEANSTEATLLNKTFYSTMMLDSLIVSNTSELSLGGPLDVTTLIVAVNGSLSHELNSDVQSYILNVTARNVTILPGGSINVEEKGYISSYGFYGGLPASDGGSYGGDGGLAHGAGLTYGSLTRPLDIGSGGYHGLAGGGTIFLNVSNTLIVNGTITADGKTDSGPSGGGSSGGSVYLISDVLKGEGIITAAGGLNKSTYGSGSGGRIAVYTSSNSFNGEFNVSGGINPSLDAAAGRAGSKLVCVSIPGVHCSGVSGALLFAENGTVNLTTQFSMNTSINVSRTLDFGWSNSSVRWQDFSSNDSMIVYYNVSGLQANTKYLVYNDGVINATLTTTSVGVLPSFNLHLVGTHNLTILQYGNTCGGAIPCTCGDKLIASRTFDAMDTVLGCSTATALVINTTGASLDCAGRVISGDGTSGNLYGIQLNASDVVIENCFITGVDSTDIRVVDHGDNSIIRNNTINSSASNMALYISRVDNLTVVNNTIQSGEDTESEGLWVYGNLTNSLFSKNRYVNTSFGFTLLSTFGSNINNTFDGNVYDGTNIGFNITENVDGVFENNTFMNENISGDVSGEYGRILSLVGYPLGNTFINTSFSSKSLIFLNQSSLRVKENSSSLVFLQTQVNQTLFSQTQTIGLNRTVLTWTDTNISVTDSLFAGFNGTVMNYTIISSTSSTQLSFYVNNQLNQTVSISNSIGSVLFSLDNFTQYNLTFALGDVPDTTCGGVEACTCGDTLIASRTFDATDTVLDCSTSTALVINTTGASLDCAGRVISGDGSSSNLYGVQLNASDVIIENCFFTGADATDIRIVDHGENSIIRNNTVNSSSGNYALLIANVDNLTVINNTIQSGEDTESEGLRIFGNLTNSLFSKNRYVNTSEGFALFATYGPNINNTFDGNVYEGTNFGFVLVENGAGIFENNTIMNENISGDTSVGSGEYGLIAGPVSYSLGNKFINTSFSSKSIKFYNATTFRVKENSSSLVFLQTQVNQTLFTQTQVTGLGRTVYDWTDTNITITDSLFAGFNGTVMNYTIISSTSSTQLSFYINNQLNKTLTISNGLVSFLVPFDNLTQYNLTFVLGDVPSSPSPSEEPSAGGGGGGGTVTTPEEETCLESHFLDRLVAGRTYGLSFADQVLLLNDFTFTSVDSLLDVEVGVEGLRTLPSTISQAPDGKSLSFYKFIFENIQRESINFAQVNFLVPKSYAPQEDLSLLTLQYYDEAGKNWLVYPLSCVFDPNFEFEDEVTTNTCFGENVQSNVYEVGSEYYVCSAIFYDLFPSELFTITVPGDTQEILPQPEGVILGQGAGSASEEVLPTPTLDEVIQVVTSPLFILLAVILAVILLSVLIVQEIILSRREIKSMKRYYHLFKVLRAKYFTTRDLKEKSEVLFQIKAIRDKSAKGWLVSNSNIFYDSLTTDAVLRHNYKVKFFGLSGRKIRIRVPVLQGEFLSAIAQDNDAIKYLQSLLGTRDDYESIVETLEFVSGKKRNHIQLWTPKQKERVRLNERISGFDFDKGTFRISASGLESPRNAPVRKKTSKKK